MHIPIPPLREDNAISPSGSLLDRGRDSDDCRDEFGFGGLPAEAKKLRYTIPLDMRLAADGRYLQDVAVNDKFAAISEERYPAERKAREEIKNRNDMIRKNRCVIKKRGTNNSENLPSKHASSVQSGLPKQQETTRVSARPRSGGKEWRC